MIKKPKVLVIDFKWDYMNPSVNSFYNALKIGCDVTFYGPGFSPLTHDLARFYDQAGPFDLMVVPMVLQFDRETLVKDLLSQKKRRKLHFDMDAFLQKHPEFCRDWRSIQCQKMLFGFADVYHMKEKARIAFEEFPGQIYSLAPDFIMPADEVVEGHLDKFALPPTDTYLNFCRGNEERIVPFMHILEDDLFKFKPIETRPYKVAVPGADYLYRERARKTLAEAGYKAYESVPAYALLLNLLSKIGLSRRNSNIAMRTAQRDIEALISNSLVTVTDGMRLKVTVRKFLEIPAWGSLMVTDGAYRMEELGFRSGEHYLFSDGRDLPELVDWAGQNLDETARIIQSAQNVVKDKHTVSVWAQRFNEIVSSIATGTYQGAFWKNGNVVLR